jgi:hypothetical protein
MSEDLEEEHPWFGEEWQAQAAQRIANQVDRQILLDCIPTPERWWHCRVVGYDTPYMVECEAYQKEQEEIWERTSWIPFDPESAAKALEFKNEFLGEYVPLEATKSFIPKHPPGIKTVVSQALVKHGEPFAMLSTYDHPEERTIVPCSRSVGKSECIGDEEPE